MVNLTLSHPCLKFFSGSLPTEWHQGSLFQGKTFQDPTLVIFLILLSATPWQFLPDSFTIPHLLYWPCSPPGQSDLFPFVHCPSPHHWINVIFPSHFRLLHSYSRRPHPAFSSQIIPHTALHLSPCCTNQLLILSISSSTGLLLKARILSFVFLYPQFMACYLNHNRWYILE